MCLQKVYVRRNDPVPQITVGVFSAALLLWRPIPRKITSQKLRWVGYPSWVVPAGLRRQMDGHHPKGNTFHDIDGCKARGSCLAGIRSRIRNLQVGSSGSLGYLPLYCCHLKLIPQANGMLRRNTATPRSRRIAYVIVVTAAILM